MNFIILVKPCTTTQQIKLKGKHLREAKTYKNCKCFHTDWRKQGTRKLYEINAYTCILEGTFIDNNPEAEEAALF